MATQNFVKVDEWVGYDTREMWDKEYAEVLATKKADKIKPYKEMDLSTLAKSTDDIWILNEHPNLRINFRKALPRSVARGMFESEEDLRDSETFKIERKAFQNKLPQILLITLVQD